MTRKLTQRVTPVLLAVGAFVAIVASHTQAYPQPRNQPAPSVAQALSAVTAVESVGMTVADMDRSIARKLRDRSTFVSPGVVAIPGQKLGFKKGFLVRDPDGHVMRLVEK